MSYRCALFLVCVLFAVGCSRNGPGSGSKASAQPVVVPEAKAPAAPMAEHPSLQAAEGLEVAVLAGGCFWGMEEIIRGIPGVKETDVGYAGGKVDKPTYDDVKKGTSGHAESVRVVFDPKVLSYEDLLAKWFFRMHDPTTANRQGNDVGSQYRSAIFVLNDAQKQVAQKVIKRANASGNWDDPIVTQVVNAGPFTPAESYHQDYLQKTPGGYTCHYLRDQDTI